MRFLTLARELASRGHEPIFALRDLTHVATVLGDEPFKVFQAPIFAGQVTGLSPAIGFAETLMRLGFVHPATLIGLCRSWVTLIEAIGPDLGLFDYAPTALLATRGTGLRRVIFGSSFSVPPRTEPMPIYQWWRGEPLARVLASERIVLKSANAALARLAKPPMERLSDLLDADESIITASEEFDQYPGRTGARYWGNVGNLEQGVAPQWPIVGSKRVFAYLKPYFRDLEAVLTALRKIDAAVIVHSPGVSTEVVRRHTAANVAFSAEPLRMVDVRRDCHVGICHAGGTVDTLVTAGKPVLALPQQLEQMMTGKRLAALGAGLVVEPLTVPAPDYARLLRRLLDETSFTTAAEVVAARHAGDEPQARVRRIVDRCEELMAAPS
jgi:hypothetical protein